MKLNERLLEYVSAGFAGIWICSHEHEDALTEIVGLCREQEWRYASWDIDRGLAAGGQPADIDQAAGELSDPLAAVRSLSALATSNVPSLLVLKNFHRFLGSPEIVQALDHQITAGKRTSSFIVILAPIVQIPTELEKAIVVIEHELPDRAQLHQIAESMATEPSDLPEGAELERLLDASAGLSRLQAEGAYGLSLVRHGRITSDAVWEVKSAELQRSGLLSLHRGSESFSDLGGLAALKQFCQQTLQPREHRVPEARPRGVLLLSPPGCGKSAFAKALGNETGRPTIQLDIGSLMGGLVGQTEEQTRRALRIIDAMAPSVVWIDELEKGLSGVQSSGQSDSGVTARLFGNLLTWLNDHTSDSFVVATCNDISKLPPEFSRAERFDGVFFIDLPGQAEKDVIWEMYLARFQLDPSQRRPADDDWTGAEIRACCRLAALLGVPLMTAARNIVPVAVTASDSLAKLRQWASGRCLSAQEPGLFHIESSSLPNGRRTQRRPSVN